MPNPHATNARSAKRADSFFGKGSASLTAARVICTRLGPATQASAIMSITMSTRNALALSPKNAIRSLPRGGILVVCGPPLGGKGPLAARVEELLPYAVKIESTDNLASERQEYGLRIARSKYSGEVESALLRDASRICRAQDEVPPLIILCARFATPALRHAAAKFATKEDVRFLLVEANSAPIRSLRRISNLMLSPKEMLARIARYELARDQYEPTTAAERSKLPALTFKSVLSNLEDIANRIVGEWCDI